MTGANAADRPHRPARIAGIETDAVLAGKGYDADADREAIRGQGRSRASRRGRIGRR